MYHGTANQSESSTGARANQVLVEEYNQWNEMSLYFTVSLLIQRILIPQLYSCNSEYFARVEVPIKSYA